MTNAKKEWYEKNKLFLREFEKTLVFKMYRNQRTRVCNLKKQLKGEERALKTYKIRMLNARERFYAKKKRNDYQEAKNGI